MESSNNGWGSICSSFLGDRCRIFKIPHHGSKTGYNEKIWKTIVERPISIITRYNRKHLPTDEMLKKIAKESSAVYVVGPKPKKDREAMKQVRKYDNYSTIRSMSMLDFDYGYVKLSKSVKEEDWHIETFGAVEQYA